MKLFKTALATFVVLPVLIVASMLQGILESFEEYADFMIRLWGKRGE